MWDLSAATRLTSYHAFMLRARLVLLLILATPASISATAPAQTPASPAKPVYTADEQAIIAKLKTLRDVPDPQRGAATRQIASQIAALPAGTRKVSLATGLSNLATEGDFGHDTLQAVADLLTASLLATPMPDGKSGQPNYAYDQLAKYVRYEHVTTTLNGPQFDRAQAALIADEAEVEKADFTLSDLTGKSWTLSALRGKVVLVNFWATWCPPCRKEMPDLATLAHRFAPQGLVVLSLSDEDRGKVAGYVSSHHLDYPILLDTGGAAAKSFHVEGIPKSFIFDRSGKLTAQSIDMRTQAQFLQLLAQAGIK